MLFNSFSFLIFFPIVMIVYFTIPNKFRKIWLLAASYYFYMCWNAIYALLILAVTVASYLGGRWISYADKKRNEKTFFSRKTEFIFIIVLLLGILFIFKYFNFAMRNIFILLTPFGISLGEGASFSLVLPVGISFYTFQALGYLIDVYRHDTPVEENFIQYALFVSFFPQLVAGPIERSNHLLRQLDVPAEFDYAKVRKGLLLMLWGFFEKILIADAAAIVVNQVYDNYMQYSAGMLVFATILFGIQIYCDFGGYSHIAIGAAQVLGIQLMDNFKQPYFATSVQDFWRRWHISLSTWFRDYVYIPLGGSHCSKAKTYRNLFLTFLVSGLWHGASWSFVLWGTLHGLYQIVGNITKKGRTAIRSFFHLKETNWLYRLLQTFLTFVLCDFAWIFFRAQSIKSSVAIIRRMCDLQVLSQLFRGTVFELGGGRQQILQLFGCIMILFVVDFLHEHKVSLRTRFLTQKAPIRWGSYALILLLFLISFVQGYGGQAAEFIYFQF